MNRIIAYITALIYSLLAFIMPKNAALPKMYSGDGVFSCGAYSLSYDVEQGTYTIAKNDQIIIQNAYCSFKIGDDSFSSKMVDEIQLESRKTGSALNITAEFFADGMKQASQSFLLDESREYITTFVTLHGNKSTNYIAPIVVEGGGIAVSNFKWNKVLEVPFDNDGWAEFSSKSIGQKTQSFEVGAVFRPDDGSGLIAGSIEHDKWKTAVETSGRLGKINNFSVICGACDPRYGSEPHGTISGEEVRSAQIFLGVFDNWKEGMNCFADANLKVQPKRAAVSNAVPMGWNSWGVVQDKLKFDDAIAASDYIHDNLQNVWNSSESLYINLDSFWDNMNDEQLSAFVAHCKQNNQKAGIYFCPFVCWWDENGMKENYIPGSQNEYYFNDVRLKKSDGTFYGNEYDGCYPLDVTHPAVEKYVQTYVERFKKLGFEYIKLDFLSQAALEGQFFNSNISSGIEAYNYAMNFVDKMIGNDMFINLAMSPIFPYQYANGRRLACDSFYSINETEYTLNAVTYGFFEKKLYEYTDPDHIVIWGKDGKAKETEARSRITSGVISGTSFLLGDDFNNPAGKSEKAFERYKMLNNADVIKIAKLGKIFTPVITNPNKRAANVYRLLDGNKEYIAVFNFNATPQTISISTDTKNFAGRELWTGKKVSGKGVIISTLAPKDAAIYEIEST